jgi:outer membrane protein TolC
VHAARFPNSHLFSRSRCAIAAAVLLAAALGGCSIWDLGPEPDHYVGASRRDGAQLLTDANLRAVTPQVPGDEPGGAAMLPGTMPAPGTAPSTAPATAPSTRGKVPGDVSVQEAILTGLDNNVALRVQRLNVPKARTSEEAALSAFDPTVSGTVQGGTTVSNGRIVDSVSASGTVTEFLPTGTTIQGRATTSNNFYSESALTNTATLTVSQALLRGAGLDVNLAQLREAELSTKITQYQLRGVAETLVANIEEAYWDLAFARQQVAIVQNALDVAERQLNDTEQRVRVQRLAPAELPAAQAEVASRRVDLINAKSNLEETRLRFLQLLAPANREFWNQQIDLSTLPFIPPGTMDEVDSHAAVALKYRPDMNEARLQLQRGDLEVVRTKNGLLPRLDLFTTLGKSSFSESFGHSVGRLFDSADYQALIGVNVDWDPINRGPNATFRAAQLTQEQLRETLDNQAQLVQLDVRTQYIEVRRTRDQIDATRAQREAREANLQVQEGKLTAGSGTSLLVAIAQRDLLSAQLAEVQSVTNHLKSLVELYRLEGTLLLRRGLDAPGATPIEGIAWRK